MPDPDGECVVTMRAGDGDEPAVPGSTRDECDTCGHDVWVSPATQASIESGEYPETIRCMECVMDSAREQEAG